MPKQKHARQASLAQVVEKLDPSTVPTEKGACLLQQNLTASRQACILFLLRARQCCFLVAYASKLRTQGPLTKDMFPGRRFSQRLLPSSLSLAYRTIYYRMLTSILSLALRV